MKFSSNDAMAVFDDKITGDEQQEIAQQLENSSLVEESMAVRQSTIDISRAGVTKNLYLSCRKTPRPFRIMWPCATG